MVTRARTLRSAAGAAIAGVVMAGCSLDLIEPGAGGGGGGPPTPCDCGVAAECEIIGCNGDLCVLSHAEVGEPCADGTCDDRGLCVPATCYDGTLDASEPDVDCGDRCVPCTNGKHCAAASDCTSGFCDVGPKDAMCKACQADDQCDDADYCNPVTAACEERLPPSKPCDADGWCRSAFCVDGVCCESACDGICEACDGVATEAPPGTCDFIHASSIADEACASPTSECSTGTCSGTGPTCGVAPAGSECGGTNCTDAIEYHYQCDDKGGCTGSSPTPCVGFMCSDEFACATDCTASDTLCQAAFYCDVSACVPDLSAGAVCTTGGQCPTGNCVDGVCCDGPCTSACQACTNAKSGGPDGTCTNIPANTDPENECGGFLCNGSGACNPPG